MSQTDDSTSRPAELSDLEFAMIVSINGFLTWVVRCAEAAGARGLSPLDVLVLHAVNDRARDKRLADICLVLNVEETHTVAYSLRKLEEQGYATHRQEGRERLYCASTDGDDLCRRYLEVRERTLVDSLRSDGVDFARLGETARSLGRMARYYGDASRVATVAKGRR